MTPHPKILQGRFDLIRDEPFFGVPLMELELAEDPKIFAMATNGKELVYNPEWVTANDERKIRTVLAHEVMHCGLLHHTRIGKRHLETWNRATDYAVNSLLEKYNRETAAKRGFSPFDLSDCLLDTQYDGLSAEEIYSRIHTEDPSDQNQSSQSGQSGKSAPPDQSAPQSSEGAVTPAPDNGEPTETQAEEARWTVILDHAEKAARMQGKMPKGMARSLKSITKPELPWHTILRQFLRDLAKDDFSWRRPSLAGIANGMLLPGLRSERMGEIVVALDTSGSVNDELLQTFLSEIAAIHAEIRPSKLHIVDCDHAIHTTAEFSPEEEILFTPKGGGGTAFAPVFDWVETNAIAPSALVYFTDLCGRFPASPPPYPVLWIDYASCTTPPWGEHIETK